MNELLNELLEGQDTTTAAPWDIIISMRQHLPANEQKVVDLMVKIDEVADMFDEICATDHGHIV